eukprot:TRINITY_DN9543_c0_g1_i13.p1 TRINITY_DN9543_c0_g1~~TRINITY_DN9543_c0_g1_i13.p1  ORF type:complete len:544 (-),score=93.93 TRINITY_DN9543_c0_g1_i13:151-1782(-)
MIRRTYAYLDDPRNFKECLIATITISIFLLVIIGFWKPSSTLYFVILGDMWTWFSWMKMSHTIPIHQWYDYNGSSNFYIGILSGYLLYIGGQIFRIFAANEFRRIPLSDIWRPNMPLDVDINAMFSMRFTIFLMTVLTYYPIIIVVTMLMVDAHKPMYRILIIFLLLNAPMMILVDYLLVQINCVSYSMFILAYFFAYKKMFTESTVATCICLLLKHVSAPMALPIGFYAIGYTWKKAEKEGKSTKNKVLAAAWITIRLSCVGAMIIFLAVIPVIRGGNLSSMLRNMFPIQTKGLVSNAINVWSLFDFILSPYDTPEYRPMWLTICTLLVAANACVAGIFLLKKPKKENFIIAFTLTHFGLYMFGFYMNEKHISYTYYPMVSLLLYSKEIMPLAYQIFVLPSFLMLAWNSDVPVQIFLLTCGVAFTVFCKRLIAQDPELRIAYVPKTEKCRVAIKFKSVFDAINSSVPKIVKWFSVYLAVFFLFNLYNMFFPVSYVNIIRRVALYKLPFISMSIVFLHQWILMYLQSTDDIEVKKYLKEFKRR